MNPSRQPGWLPGREDDGLMAADEIDALREELRDLEDRLAEQQREADELRQEIGSRSDGPGDRVDLTSLITSLELQEAVIESLEARRRELRQRLGKD
jgi:hypothetical protein